MRLARSLPFRIVGGPDHGKLLWPTKALIAQGGLIHSPVMVKGDAGTVQVVKIAAYALEIDTRRAVYQVEEQVQ